MFRPRGIRPVDLPFAPTTGHCAWYRNRLMKCVTFIKPAAPYSVRQSPKEKMLRALALFTRLAIAGAHRYCVRTTILGSPSRTIVAR